jgi:hypothetical protein
LSVKCRLCRSGRGGRRKARPEGINDGIRGRAEVRGGEGLPRPQEGPGEEEQFAHDGDDHHLGRFAFGPQALGKDAQARIRTHSHDGGEVERAAEVCWAERPDAAVSAHYRRTEVPEAFSRGHRPT